MPYGTTSKHFSSSYPNAPAFYADAGGCVGPLDALLVNGYGAAVISQIVVTDGVAVCTTTLGHSLRPWMVTLNEDTGHAGLDGEHRVIAAAGATFTFEVTDVPNGSYTGGSCKVAPLGFEISYSATNRRIYRSKDTERRNAVSLYVDDTNTAAGWNIGGNKALAQVKMVCDVVSIDSYTELANAWWYKSSATTGTSARQWLVQGDALGLYGAIEPVVASGNASSFHFMQLNSLAVGDQFATMLEGAAPTTGAATTVAGLGSAGCQMSAMQYGARSVARGLAQIGSGLALRYFGLGALGQLGASPCGLVVSGGGFPANQYYQAAALAEANLADNSVVLGRDVLAVHQPAAEENYRNGVVRGRMPGLVSVPSYRLWSMAPMLHVSTLETGSVLMELPASAGTDAYARGGYFVEVCRNWRHA